MQNIKENLRKKLINVVVSLDIEGAFNSAWWPAIKNRLLEKRCPQNLRRVIISYFTNRSVSIGYAGKIHRKPTTKGCVQGSIADLPSGMCCWIPYWMGWSRIEYTARHLLAISSWSFPKKNGKEIEKTADNTLRHVEEWGTKNKLKFGDYK